MALLVNPKLPGGARYAEPLYYVAHQIGRDKITGAVHGKLHAYANEETRRAHQAALDKAGAALGRLKSILQEIGQLSKLYPDDLETRAIEEVRLHGEKTMAQRQLKAAEEHLRQNDVMLAPMQIMDLVVPPTEASTILKDGTVNEAMVYAWLKSRPEFEGAIDA